MKIWPVALSICCIAYASYFFIDHVIERAAWYHAISVDTPEAYLSYASKFSGSASVNAARMRSAALLDQKEWATAEVLMSPDVLRDYLTSRPQGVWAEFATTKLMDVTPQNLPAGLSDVTADVEVPEPLVSGTGKREVPARHSSAMQSDNESVPIQLGAFSSPALARKGWNELASRFMDLKVYDPIIDAAPWKSSKLFRLRIKVSDLSRAKMICKLIKKDGYECVLARSAVN